MEVTLRAYYIIFIMVNQDSWLIMTELWHIFDYNNEYNYLSSEVQYVALLGLLKYLLS